MKKKHLTMPKPEVIQMDDIPTLEIDMDKECTRCNTAGVGKGGLCLQCVSELLKKAQFDAIGTLTLQKAKAEICNMIDEYHKEIDEAYVKADGELTVALGLKMAGTRMAGEVELIVSINFVESRIKHAVKILVNEKQIKIPGV